MFVKCFNDGKTKQNNLISANCLITLQAFSFLTTFCLVGLIVWLILYLVLGWGKKDTKYQAVKVQMV